MRDIGRGETAERCELDVEGEEMRALEELFRGVLALGTSGAEYSIASDILKSACPEGRRGRMLQSA